MVSGKVLRIRLRFEPILAPLREFLRRNVLITALLAVFSRSKDLFLLPVLPLVCF